MQSGEGGQKQRFAKFIVPAIFRPLKIKCGTFCIHLRDYHTQHDNSATSNDLIGKLHASEKSQRNNAEVTHVNLVKWFLKDDKKAFL